MCELVPESRIQDGGLRVAHVISTEFAKVAVEEEGKAERECNV